MHVQYFLRKFPLQEIGVKKYSNLQEMQGARN